MAGVSIRVEHNDQHIRAALLNLIALGENPADAMRDIATFGENTTRERFRTQIGPDGVSWKPSLRVQISGGRTLTKDGHLGDSVSSRSTSNYAEWGVNRIYAAIQQFGGWAGRGLRSKIDARAYIGTSPDDEVGILDILQRRINGLLSRYAR